MKNIILVGFMGCGKTSVGIRLSYRMRYTVTDTDRWIESRAKATVSEIFDKQGEEAFRQMETECLKTLLTQETKERILSVGGGLPLRKENAVLLKKLGTVVYLRVRAETVIGRLSGDTTRPLLKGEDPEGTVRRLLKERDPLYEQVADMILDVDGRDPDAIADEIADATAGQSSARLKGTNRQERKEAGL